MPSRDSTRQPRTSSIVRTTRWASAAYSSIRLMETSSGGRALLRLGGRAAIGRSGPFGDRRHRGRGHHLERRGLPGPELEGQRGLMQEQPQPTEDGRTALARGRLHRGDGRVVEEIDDEGRVVDRRQRQLLAIDTEGGRVDDEIGRGRRRVLEWRDDELRR